METVAQATRAVTRPTMSLQRSGWLLIAAPFCFLAVIVVAIVGGLAGRGPDVTSIDQLKQLLAPISAAWVAIWIISTIPYLLIAIAIVRIQWALYATNARLPLLIGCVVAVIGAAIRLFLCYLNTGILVDAPLIASQPINAIGTPIGWIGLQPIADGLLFMAVFCIAIGLFRSHILRRTGLVVSLVCMTLLAIHLFIMVSATFADGLPPIVPTLLSLALGIGLARFGRIVIKEQR